MAAWISISLHARPPPLTAEDAVRALQHPQQVNEGGGRAGRLMWSSGVHPPATTARDQRGRLAVALHRRRCALGPPQPVL